jgi:OPT oligopeptide transporter protein
MQVGMQFLSEVIAGALFPGKPFAVLTCMVYGRQILEQNLNLISDYKFGFYMKIPEKEMFIGQVYGTLLGPFINYGMMRKSPSTLFFKALTDHVQRLHHQQ